MNSTTRLMDRAKAMHGLTSDGELARFLAWPRATVGSYRAERTTFDVVQVADFAAKTKIPLADVLNAAVEDRKLRRIGAKGQRSLELQVA